MSRSNPLFSKAPVQVQNRNTFDVSCERLGTGKVGTLYPILCQKIMPNTDISVGHRSHIQLPPFATNAYGRIDFKFEAFFVPNRILMGRAWQDYTLYNNGTSNQYQSPGAVKRYIPLVRITAADLQYDGVVNWIYGNADLANSGDNSYYIANALPLLAYHKIWDEFYRCSNYTIPSFNRGATGSNTDPSNCDCLPYTSQIIWRSTDRLNGQRSLFALQQRAYNKDYFTNCYLNQNGGATQMQVSVTPSPLPDQGSTSTQLFQNGTNVVTGNSYTLTQIGTFTVQQLRSANALQQFAERNAAAGGRYADTILANYGTVPADAVIDRPIFLGNSILPVYNNTVYNATSTSDNSTATQTPNPFTGNVGSKAGDRSGVGQNRLVDDFHATEQGYLIVMASLVPHAYYGSLLDHETAHINATGEVGFSDLFPVPALASIGNQPIYLSEITADLTTDDFAKDAKFGWTDRYSEYKFNNDRVLGNLQDGQSMSAFAIKRSFYGLQSPGAVAYIKTTDLDDVTAVSSALSNYGYQFDVDFQIAVTCPLPAYTIPTLGEPKDTHTITVDKGGKRL